ncbi:MAG: glycosyltransferase family A protein [Archaeoglobaceae archaeon]|nr:glycosyltransferase family 2 protein [Archaeoglobaceae archaeon]MDW7989228.1 glycosyltransferase family A protein [Archaeoglobaceae archaeon]
MKALIVILNKDNAEKLKECIDSIIKQSSKICEDFDVLVIDGGSRDSSKEVVENFSKIYPCVKFKVQERLGGTGFARREACEYAIKNDYKAIIWGDSENIYKSDYVEKVLDLLRNYDIVGGKPLVRGNFFAHAFAWYHAIHIIFGIQDRHIPGNNKAEKVAIYRFCEYPESKRAEDYGFSLLLMKKGIKLKQGVVDAKVIVSIPENIKGVFKWQKARVIGCAEALRFIDFKPYDLILWSSLLPLLILTAFLIPFSLLALAILLSILILSIFLFVKSFQFIENPKKKFFFAPLVGLVIHSAFSILGIYYYMKFKKRRGWDLNPGAF